ncbi:MAG: heat-inducible transcriptional repressor HrcA [Armatimonadota bacterium]
MELYERRCRILAAVVHDYVETAEPIGSETLARRHDFGVKPATIRNELAAMSDLGYLRQPHTSAGRIPSDLGYRFYVDELMPIPRLGQCESTKAKKGYTPVESEVEEILQRTCRILSELTKYTSIATNPQVEVVTVNQVALLAVKPGILLAITVLNTGHVDHRALEYSGSISQADVVSLGNFVNARFAGTEMGGFHLRADEELPPELARLDWLYKKIVPLLRQALSAATDDHIYVDGTSHMLKQPEFAQSGRAARVMEALERRRVLFQMLGSAILGSDVMVIIGSENRFEEMRECSFIAASYSIGGKPCGSIGVVGPTRMDYRRAVAAVRFMALNLSELLTSLSG